MSEVAASVAPSPERLAESTSSKEFSHTEIGLLPADWNVPAIGDVCKLINGRGFKPHEWKARGTPILRIQNLNGSDDFNYYDGSYNKKIEVPYDQLLFAWSGSRGTSFGPHIWKGPFALLNYHTWKVAHDNELVDRDFLFHALRSLTEYIEGWAHGASALVHVQKWQMEKFQIPLPPTKREQQAIACALNDADADADVLGRLIEKKRAIQQGAMQDLLTGNKRLSGFHGEWRESTLQEIGDVLNGLTYSPANVRDDGTLVLRSSNIQEGNLSFDNNVFVKMDIPEQCHVRENDILICVRNGSRDLIGKTAKIDKRCGGMAFGAFMAVFRTPLPNFMLYQFRSGMMKRQIAERLGATINQITNTSLKSFVVKMPPTDDEARAIGGVLAEMDQEISSLIRKLSKVREIKQGMMQELLTGRIRLV